MFQLHIPLLFLVAIVVFGFIRVVRARRRRGLLVLVLNVVFFDKTSSFFLHSFWWRLTFLFVTAEDVVILVGCFPVFAPIVIQCGPFVPRPRHCFRFFAVVASSSMQLWGQFSTSIVVRSKRFERQDLYLQLLPFKFVEHLAPIFPVAACSRVSLSVCMVVLAYIVLL